jgi:putative Mg2+ transporter-C (MgtC) family protein
VFRRAVGRDQVVVGLNTAAAIFAAAAIGAAAGQGRLLVAAVATALTLFVLEIRHLKVVHVLDGRRWAGRFSDDESPPGGPGPGVPGVPGVARPGVPGASGSGSGPNLDS